jgi:ABC-2 type transport system ATP-binding protein
MAPVVEIEGLRKEYRRRKGRTLAVDGLDLSVAQGTVYGFLGPNGSGKTTTIRCLLGLVTATAGRVRLFGREVPAALPDVLRRTGAIVEAPAHFPSMTGRENLLLLGAMEGIGPARVDQVLDQVALGERGRDLVRHYSLGMRQRLGLAAALLKDPELVVLDEPANGLDPAGIRQVRDLLRALGREGRTVLVSSHILAEVEQTCDAVAILSRGRCVAEGSVASVLAAAGDTALWVKVDDIAAGADELRRAGFQVERRTERLYVTASSSDASEITRILAARRLWVTELRPDERTLEDLFLELTSTDTPPPAAAEGTARLLQEAGT